ncbi:MAG: DUF3789 domain-containing protein [Ruminococcaceae bacterium]|nr:DUF3789 domain-containing protein [Oscillospiraceae bacterium]
MYRKANKNEKLWKITYQSKYLYRICGTVGVVVMCLVQVGRDTAEDEM